MRLPNGKEPDKRQAQGIAALLRESRALPHNHRAYILATAWHETGGALWPVYEKGARAYFNKYEPGTKLGKALGNAIDGDGYRLRGRGFVQITGRRNYAKASAIAGMDLMIYPDKALDIDIAAKICVHGMATGLFTGRRLSDFVYYRDMRRVVNGTDKAGLIEGYALHFQEYLPESQISITEADFEEPTVPARHSVSVLPAPKSAPRTVISWLTSKFRA
jgi:putative chitinase